MLTVEERLAQETIKDIPTSNMNLSLTIRNLLLEEITDNVLKQTPKLKQLTRKIRSELKITPLQKVERFKHVLGVDAGSQIIPLASRQYAVIGALAYMLPHGGRFFLQPESLSQPYSNTRDNFRATVDIRREARLYETAYRCLEGDPCVEVVFIDGPLAFSNWWAKAGSESDRQRLINAVNRLIRKCRDLDVVLTGIVKRPSARHLVHFLGLEKETDLTDSFLMLHTLEAGERTEVFSPKTGLRMATRSSPLMDAIDAPIYSAYVRVSRDWQIPPIRVDVPAFCLDRFDDVADYCYATSYWNGVPLPIVKADEAVKVSRRFIGDVYSEILSKVSRANGEVSQLAPYWGEAGWMGV